MFVPHGYLSEVSAGEHSNTLFTAASLPIHFRFADRLVTYLAERAAEGDTPASSHRDVAINSMLIYTAFFLSGAMRKAVASESYAVPVLLRAAIECAGYASHMVMSADAANAWVRRHEELAAEARKAAEESRNVRLEVFFEGDAGGRRASRNAFTTRNWQESLSELLADFPRGTEAAAHLKRWYDIAIDTGAHPNILMTLIGAETIRSRQGETATRIHNLFTGNPELIASDIENVFRVGLSLARVLLAIKHPPRGNQTLLELLDRLEGEFFRTMRPIP